MPRVYVRAGDHAAESGDTIRVYRWKNGADGRRWGAEPHPVDIEPTANEFRCLCILHLKVDNLFLVPLVDILYRVGRI